MARVRFTPQAKADLLATNRFIEVIAVVSGYQGIEALFVRRQGS